MARGKQVQGLVTAAEITAAKRKVTSLRASAEAARLDSLSPVQLADEMSREAFRAENDLLRLEQQADAEAAVAPAAAPVEPLPAVPTAAASDGVERARAVELATVGAQATRMGVAFNVDEAITSGTSAHDARAHVLQEVTAQGERARIVEMRSVAASAERLGYAEKTGRPFDLMAAIFSGEAPRVARNRVLDALATMDEALVTNTSVSVHTSGDASEKAIVRAGQDRAIDRYATRHGLKRAAP